GVKKNGNIPPEIENFIRRQKGSADFSESRARPFGGPSRILSRGHTFPDRSDCRLPETFAEVLGRLELVDVAEPLEAAVAEDRSLRVPVVVLELVDPLNDQREVEPVAAHESDIARNIGDVADGAKLVDQEHTAVLRL